MVTHNVAAFSGNVDTCVMHFNFIMTRRQDYSKSCAHVHQALIFLNIFYPNAASSID